MLRLQLKAEAKRLVTSAKPSPLLMTLIYVGITLVISLLLTAILTLYISVDGYTDEIQSSMQDVVRSSDAVSYDELVDEIYSDPVVKANIQKLVDSYMSYLTNPVAVLLTLALMFISGILGIGLTVFSLNTTNGTSSFSDILGGFSFILRLILYWILTSIFVFLWSLLFVIPGIIASYRYRMALYLIIEHPEMSVLECIRESSRMMKGHKAELFVMDLSFIGWYLLMGLPYVGYAAQIWVMPYYQITNALYYRYLYGITHREYYGSPEVNAA